MKENLQAAIDFAARIKSIKGILQVVLFGSVARGEDTAASDIDIAVIHDARDVQILMREVNTQKPEKVQVTFVKQSNLPRETELMGALSGEGLLLVGRPIMLQQRKTELKAKLLIAYSLAHLPRQRR